MSAKFIFGSAAAYLTMTAAEKAASILVFPLTTRVLTPADYGVMLLISNVTAIINLLFAYSLVQSLPTLFSHASSESERRAAFTTVIVSVLAVLLAFYAAMALLSNEMSAFFLQTPAYGMAIKAGALSFFAGACAISLAMVARLLERHTLYLAAQLPALLLQVAITVTLFFTGALTVTTQYISTAVAGLLSATIYIVTLRHWLSGRFETEKLASAGRIGMQMLPWQAAMLLTMNSAAFFLTRSGHLDEAGLLLAATSAAALLLAVSGGFSNVWTPFVLLRKDQPDLPQMQVRIFSLYSSALLMAAAALGLFSHELFFVLAGPAFREGYRFVPALVLAFSILSFADCFAQGLQARNRTVHYAWIGLTASAVFVITALGLARGLGAWGIITAMIAAFSVMLVLLQIVSARLMPVAYPWTRHALMWAVAIGVVSAALPLDIGWGNAAIKLAGLVLIGGLPFAFGAVRWSDVLLARTTLLPSAR